VREAHALTAKLAETLTSIDDTVARTRDVIAASRALIDLIERQIAPEAAVARLVCA
jgi:hypothetical protein